VESVKKPEPIGRYEYIRYVDPADAFRPYDERAPAVAAEVAGLIIERAPDAIVEHVGSTAIPGCHGKGVIDLMVLYPPGRLEATRDTIDGLGFQRQTNRNPFPEERPVRVGAIDYDGTTFRIHVHVIAAGSREVAEQIGFRDRLRGDPALVAEYVAGKRSVLAAGVSDSIEYNAGKDPFIRRVIAELPPSGEGDG
jgi:GrpB-like predicted nucleotidyltransferase (UPF0157 family)